MNLLFVWGAKKKGPGSQDGTFKSRDTLPRLQRQAAALKENTEEEKEKLGSLLSARQQLIESCKLAATELAADTHFWNEDVVISTISEVLDALLKAVQTRASAILDLSFKNVEDAVAKMPDLVRSGWKGDLSQKASWAEVVERAEPLFKDGVGEAVLKAWNAAKKAWHCKSKWLSPNTNTRYFWKRMPRWVPGLWGRCSGRGV